MINYFEIINSEMDTSSRMYKIYLVHCVLVTNKALRIARKLGLSAESLTFIEEAAMLHDIGVVRVNSPKMDCVGELPYIAHGVAGAEILRAWSKKQGWDESVLARHILIAERHVGVGLTQKEINDRDLPLPKDRDFVPESIEEQIITYADLFFSKRENTLWLEDAPDEIEAELSGYGAGQVEIFREWRAKFE